MRTLAEREGLGEDLVIVNSCAVTGEAVRQTRQAIRRARRDHPDARILVTGCAAQIDAQDFAAMPEVDHVLGNGEKMAAKNFSDLAAGRLERVRVNDIFAVRTTAPQLIEGFSERARAFVEVQTGCDHRCTFCIIPFGRGASRSVPMGAVVEQVRRLVARGYREVVLTGVDLTSYGGDLPGRPTLGALVGRILDLVPELPRLRLSSIDAIEIDAALFDRIAGEERLMPHLHLSLQSGDDLILKRMKRRHSRAEALDLIARLRAVRPELLFGADIIAGFPTETEEMFANTCRMVEEAGIAFLHVFPYSPREGTPAARMPQVSPAVRKARARRLRELGMRIRTRAMEDLIGRRLAVLVERVEDGTAFGHSAEFAPVRIERAAAAGIGPGEIVTLCAEAFDGDELVAQPNRQEAA
ncbi:MAG: tRNA (N(6)-L-threonylcarbamoyladenosine(37)-C(2))-methylthiotransferase MtaB [Alphaproteobacteria bacterium]|nr:MAG: tRNA (N(6)-L-threonylcarbamoyladenosine(37)-C(2))-methylthiotransferase MtaB [Alphaproteobacteria bacterium]